MSGDKLHQVNAGLDRIERGLGHLLYVWIVGACALAVLIWLF